MTEEGLKLLKIAWRRPTLWTTPGCLNPYNLPKFARSNDSCGLSGFHDLSVLRAVEISSLHLRLPVQRVNSMANSNFEALVFKMMSHLVLKPTEKSKSTLGL